MYFPLYDMIRHYAIDHGYSLLEAELFNARGLDRLHRYLPKGWANIPMYTSTEDSRGLYRTAIILRRVRNSREMRMYILPINKRRDGHFYGVAYVASEIPATRHWLKLYPDSGLVESKDDQDLESNVFNRKYQLTGSDPKLLTEVFDPLLIEQFNAKKHSTCIARVRTTVAEFSERGNLTPGLLSEAVLLFEDMEKRFLRAYLAYPEPTK